MNLKVRTHRSIPSRLNAVALTKYTGVWVVRKKLRIAGIPVRGLVLTTRCGPDGADGRRRVRAARRGVNQRTTRTGRNVHPRPSPVISLTYRCNDVISSHD